MVDVYVAGLAKSYLKTDRELELRLTTLLEQPCKLAARACLKIDWIFKSPSFLCYNICQQNERE
jgi:hypothetical protein